MQRGFFTVLDSPDWVNIIPITDDGSIVFVKQYRHGSDSVSLELPGGLKEKNESALDAAKRECTEETGFIGTDDPIQIGVSLPNPAFLTNQCTSFVWMDCKKLNGQNLDSHEVIDVVTIPIPEISSI
jgi:8-oxo-dGTP pyrophosphatase MutT (NUDIX family)